MSINTQSVSVPRSSENTWLWMLKSMTGILLVVLLGIHLVVNHFIGEGGLLTYADVVAYYQNPIIPIMEICFLAAVVSHSLIGLRGIVLDLNPSRKILKVFDVILVIGGLSAVAYGIWLVLVIVSKG